MPRSTLKVLLIDDDSDDYALTLALLREIDAAVCTVTWCSSYDQGMAEIRSGEHEVCLLDHRLGERTGVEMLAELSAAELDLPIIMLTAEGGSSTERSALESGAADYLVKGTIDAEKLWRSIRHATERGLARRAFREQDRMFRAVFDLSVDAMVVLDNEGRLMKCNAAAIALFGRPSAQPIGLPVRELTGRAHGTLEIERPDGTRRTLEFRGTSDILPGRHLSVLRDVTERLAEEQENKRLRTRLAIADRMASVGTLAAGVAHEINNPLAALLLNLESARSEGAADRTLLDEAIEAAERVRNIVADLKGFSRSDDEVRTRVDLRAAIESTLGLVRNEIRHRARLLKDYQGTPAVYANEGRLGQVFLNLLVNAAQAIDEGGADSNEIRIATRVEGSRAIVEISDTGCGIAPADLGRIFDPFFTTKAVGEGTGLGLPICHNIISGLGGEITVESAAGPGTTFRVALPLANDVSVRRLVKVETDPGGPRGRVLIIDDEPAIVSAVTRILARDHEVVGLNDAAEALRRLRAGEQFDVILCDLMMPHMTGMDLHRALQHAVPPAAEKMVFLCGGAFTQKARAFLDEVGTRRIDKPFESAKLRSAIRGLVRSGVSAVPGSIAV